MEAVARQFATDEHVMVIRNGWFSFRWTEIFDMGGENNIPKSHTVLKAVPVENSGDGGPTQYHTHPIADVVKKIKEERPAVVFAPRLWGKVQVRRERFHCTRNTFTLLL